ncbi:hypothetical protein VTO73DRAFT_10353 [Trametes versicolor]
MDFCNDLTSHTAYRVNRQYIARCWTLLLPSRPASIAPNLSRLHDSYEVDRTSSRKHDNSYPGKDGASHGGHVAHGPTQDSSASPRTSRQQDRKNQIRTPTRNTPPSTPAAGPTPRFNSCAYVTLAMLYGTVSGGLSRRSPRRAIELQRYTALVAPASFIRAITKPGETWLTTTRGDAFRRPSSKNASFHIARAKTSVGDALASVPGVVLETDFEAPERVIPEAERRWTRDVTADMFDLWALRVKLECSVHGGSGASADSKDLQLSVGVSQMAKCRHYRPLSGATIRSSRCSSV